MGTRVWCTGQWAAQGRTRAREQRAALTPTKYYAVCVHTMSSCMHLLGLEAKALEAAQAPGTAGAVHAQRAVEGAAVETAVGAQRGQILAGAPALTLFVAVQAAHTAYGHRHGWCGQRTAHAGAHTHERTHTSHTRMCTHKYTHTNTHTHTHTRKSHTHTPSARTSGTYRAPASANSAHSQTGGCPAGAACGRAAPRRRHVFTAGIRGGCPWRCAHAHARIEATTQTTHTHSCRPGAQHVRRWARQPLITIHR